MNVLKSLLHLNYKLHLLGKSGNIKFCTQQYSHKRSLSLHISSAHKEEKVPIGYSICDGIMIKWSKR